MGRLDDARRRAVALRAVDAQPPLPSLEERRAAMVADVDPLMRRLMRALRAHAPAPGLRRQHEAERAAQFAVHRQTYRRAKRKDFTSKHPLVGDYEGGTTYTGIGLLLNGDGPGGVVLMSVASFRSFEGATFPDLMRLQLDLDAMKWEVRERRHHYAHVGPDTYSWQYGLAVSPPSPQEHTSGGPTSGYDDHRKRFRDAIDDCAVQLIDYFGIPQAEVEV